MIRLAAVAALLAVSLASACHVAAVPTAAREQTPASVPAPVEAPVAAAASTPLPEGLVVLAVGQSADIAESTKLTFERIASDSRCPAGAQCVWEGEVSIALALTSAAGLSRFELSQHDSKTAEQSFEIEFVSFGACPARNTGAAPAGECASLRVDAGSAQ